MKAGPPPEEETAASARGRWRALRAAFSKALAGAPLKPGEIPGIDAFERETIEAMSRQHTARAQKILRMAVFVVVALLAWAALARVDEVTRGDGRVVPSRQLQVLQSLDGGVVERILAHEGDKVEPGQLLLRIDPTRATSAVRDSAAQGIALQARVARLRALAQGTTFLPPTPATDDERAIVNGEKRLYDSRVTELSTQISIVRQQLSQREQELAEMQAKKTAALRALELSTQELNQTRPLLATGAVSQVDILRLERDATKSKGDVDQSTAQIGRVQASIQESNRKIQETELAFRNEAGRDLAEALGKLNALNEGAIGLADKVDKTQVKSPVRGRIQRLLANTVGGVVEAGKDIVEIVPLDDSLVLDARVQPRDIAFIHPGQTANVKFTAYDFSIYGGLEATVENISPDTVIDEKGNAYYVVRVRTRLSSFDEKLPIIPGMTAEVDILTGKKTVLSYLLKPVLKIKSYALRER
ncbi:MAG: HlyD family type I secretion periplasmic adaptor subunit [Burkholderiaceae bacterium]